MSTYILSLIYLFGTLVSSLMINHVPTILQLSPFLGRSSEKYIYKNINIILSFLFVLLISGLSYFLLIIIASRSLPKGFTIDGLMSKWGDVIISFFGYFL